jgi:hypothetical protein
LIRRPVTRCGRIRRNSSRSPTGHGSTPACSAARLADDLPEITELDLNPVIARPDGAFVVDARANVTAYRAQDPFLRKLR